MEREEAEEAMGTAAAAPEAVLKRFEGEVIESSRSIEEEGPCLMELSVFVRLSEVRSPGFGREGESAGEARVEEVLFTICDLIVDNSSTVNS